MQSGVRYNDGPYTSVDWTNAAVLQNAIVQGPVKIGVAATQLQNAVQGDPPVSGWCATGFQTDPTWIIASACADTERLNGSGYH